MTLVAAIKALAAAVGADIKSLLTGLGGKVDKAPGQSLMTDAERAKLDGIATGAQVNVATNVGQGTRTSTGIPLISSTGSGTTLPVATTSLAGLQSAADKVKLNGIATGAQVNVATNLSESTRTATTVSVTSSTGSSATLSGASATQAGVMTAADKGKLDGIAANAQVNTVASVAGKTGVVVLAKADVGLSSVDNTSDIAKPVSTAQQTAISARVAISDVLDVLTSTDAQKPLSANQGRVLKGLIDSIHTLLVSDETNLDTLQEIVDFIELNRATLNALGISNIAGLQTALDARYTKVESDAALSGKVDKAIGKQLSTEDFSTAEKTKLSGIAAGAQVNAVTSVAGRTGAVVVAKADVGLGSVDNTSDANKPVSTAQATAIALKQGSHVNLTALSGLAGAADRLPYFTGAGALGLATLTAKARSLLASADDAAMRSFLGLGSAATTASSAYATASQGTKADAAVQPPPSDGKQYAYKDGAWVEADAGLAGAIDFAIIYPNGGSAGSPANVATNSRYVEANPFPGHPVIVDVQLFDATQSAWGNPSWNGFNGNNPIGSRGVFCAQVADSIVLVTGGSYVLGTAQDGNPFTPANARTSAPCRVRVWKVKGALA